MTNETQRPHEPEQPLSQIEQYVLDMGNRFSEAVRMDDAYTSLQDRLTTLDYDIPQLQRYEGRADTVARLQQERDERAVEFQRRKLLLVELWEEAHGEEGVFKRLIALEDLRAQLEADPERTELLDEYRDAKTDLDTYRFSIEGPHPSSD